LSAAVGVLGSGERGKRKEQVGNTLVTACTWQSKAFAKGQNTKKDGPHHALIKPSHVLDGNWPEMPLIRQHGFISA